MDQPPKQDKGPPPAREDRAWTDLRTAMPVEYRPTLETLVRAAKNPAAVTASLRALGPGGAHHKRGVTWSLVGRALQDWASSGEAFRVRTIEIFIGTLLRQDEPASGRRARESQQDRNLRNIREATEEVA